MLSSLKEALALIEKESYADTRFLADKGKLLLKKSRKWERAAGYLLQGLSHVHRAAVVAFFVLPQKIIPDAAPRREAVPRKAKIGFLHETEAEPTARPQKTKIGFLHETEAEPTARQEPEHIGFFNSDKSRNSSPYSAQQLKIIRTRLVRLLAAAALAGTAFAQKETSQDPTTHEPRSVVRVGTLGVTLMNATFKGNKDTDFNIRMIGAEKARKAVEKMLSSSASQTNETQQKSVPPQVLSKKSERDL